MDRTPLETPLEIGRRARAGLLALAIAGLLAPFAAVHAEPAVPGHADGAMHAMHHALPVEGASRDACPPAEEAGETAHDTPMMPHDKMMAHVMMQHVGMRACPGFTVHDALEDMTPEERVRLVLTHILAHDAQMLTLARFGAERAESAAVAEVSEAFADALHDEIAWIEHALDEVGHGEPLPPHLDAPVRAHIAFLHGLPADERDRAIMDSLVVGRMMAAHLAELGYEVMPHGTARALLGEAALAFDEDVEALREARSDAFEDAPAPLRS